MNGTRWAWSKWLDSHQWHWWFTLTFRLPPSSRTSIDHFKRWVATLQLQGLRTPGFFVGSEVGPRGGREHFHGLIRFHQQPDANHRTSAWRWWFKHYGRAQVSVFQPLLGAEHYVSKYVAKELSVYDVGGTWQEYTTSENSRESGTETREPQSLDALRDLVPQSSLSGSAVDGAYRELLRTRPSLSDSALLNSQAQPFGLSRDTGPRKNRRISGKDKDLWPRPKAGRPIPPARPPDLT